MEDKELLELAAKAAEVELYMWVEEAGCFEIIIPWKHGLSNTGYWDPLKDDGDALRLAVRLNLHIEIDCDSAGAVTIEWDFDQGGIGRQFIEQDAPMGGDDYTATRRAIVRAAAEIGRNIK